MTKKEQIFKLTTSIRFYLFLIILLGLISVNAPTGLIVFISLGMSLNLLYRCMFNNYSINKNKKEL